MLKLGLKSNLLAPLSRMQKLVQQAQDLKPLFQKWSQVLRADAKARITSGEGFPPLAESTLKRLQHTRTGAVTAQGKVRKSYAKHLEVYLNRQVRAEHLDEDVLSDLETLVRGGQKALSLDLSDRRANALVRLQAQLKKAALGKRVGGNQHQSDKHKPLGKLGQTITSKAEANQAVAESRIPWSGIHQEGGTAGHGAQIPARPFFVMTPELKQKLEKLTLKHFLISYIEDDE